MSDNAHTTCDQRDTRTYDNLGAALRAMPYESREIMLALTHILVFELTAPMEFIVTPSKLGEIADTLVERLAEHFDHLAGAEA